MTQSKLQKIAFLLVLSSFCLAAGILPSKLERGFEALEEFNYFEAKKLFYKSLKKDSVAASYGLSVIYGRNDNPFHNLDSAFAFISIALKSYPNLESKKREAYDSLGVDSLSIALWASHIDNRFYEIAQLKADIKVWNEFIAEHHTDSLVSQAVLFRDELAFEKARQVNTSYSYQDFIQAYPESNQLPQAQRKLEQKIFEEATLGGLISEYRRFIENHPESPYRQEAEYRIYEKYSEDGSTEAYLKFIEENPNNPNTQKAWRQIFALEVGSLTAKTLAQFTISYPDYPYMDELRQDFAYATTNYYPIEINGKYGFIDEKGQIKIEPIYEWVEPFSENVALVGLNGRVLFITKGGERITSQSFDDAYSFKNGFALVENEGKFGVINRLGEFVIPIEYEDLGEFSEGYFYASNGSYYGYFKETGQLAIDFQFDNAVNFTNSRAVVSMEGALGVINTNGSPVSDFRYQWIEPFHQDRRPSRMRIGDKFGLIDQVGNVVCDTLYDRLGVYNEGLILAANEDNYGFLNYRGDTIVDFRYNLSQEAIERSSFTNGHAMVFQEDKVGIIDSTGNKVFPAIFEDVGLYLGDLIPVKKRGKWGFSDLDVNLAIPYQYEFAENFVDSLAIVKLKEGFTIIDRQGNTLINQRFTSLAWLDTFLLASDTLFGLFDRQGNTIIPMEYQSIQPVNNFTLSCKLPEGKTHYFDLRNKKYIWKP